jgi:hypothetical protein
MGPCKKSPACNLAAFVAKEYFFETQVSLILLRKSNETCVSRKFMRLCKYSAAYGGEIKFQSRVFNDFAKQNR